MSASRILAVACPSLLCVALLCLAPLGLVACDRNTEPYVEGEPTREPDLSRIFPEQGREGVEPRLPEAPGLPAAPGAARAATAAPAGAGIRGRVELGEGLAPATDGVLFVIARREGQAAGPPVAALRLPGPSFPQEFEIGPGNVMIPGMTFTGALSIEARLDGDGDVMSRAPGDLRGVLASAAQPGDEGVVIVLDERL